MTPADISRHTAEVRALLKDPSYKRVAASAAFDPYAASGEKFPERTGPWTFVWGWANSESAKKDKAAWDAMIAGFKLAMGSVYPECQAAQVPVEVEDWKHTPLVMSQIYAKMRRSLRGPLVFIEVDVVCNKRCDPFESEFDVGITDCADQWPMMPFNPGVMFVRDTPGAQLFLDTAMEYCNCIPQNADTWYSYQFALSHAYLTLKDQIDIKIFPHEEYNYPPDSYAPSEACFIHLKGGRKSMQRDYVMPLLSAHDKKTAA